MALGQFHMGRFAAALGLHQSFISRLERGQCPSVRSSTVPKLAAAYGCRTADEFLAALQETVELFRHAAGA